MIKTATNKPFLYFISFFSGFSCLALEIVWVRIISFMNKSAPQAFSFTLAIFLLGIAIGALIGKKLCEKLNNVSTGTIGVIYFFSALIDILIIYLAYLATNSNNYLMFYGLLLFCSATIRGIVFPLVHHLGANKAKTGKEISNVYFSNVFGSAIAPLLVSFILLDYFTTQELYLLIAGLTLFVSALCVAFETKKINLNGVAWYAGSILIFFWVILIKPFDLIIQIASNSPYPNTPPSRIIENTHGIVQEYVAKEPNANTSVIFGNNAYDGRLNTNLFNDTNGIDRAYYLASIKPNVKNILVIGMSSGAWLKVLSDIPTLEKITVVEINPAYKEIIETAPNIATVLTDPKVEIIYDDGRKWLNKHKDTMQFDMVVVNTTWHWRNYSSNLLSLEFNNLIKSIMSQDALYYFNATKSIDAFKTTKEVFPYAYLHDAFSMSVGSFKPIVFDPAAVKDRLCSLRDSKTKKIIFNNENSCNEAFKIINKSHLIPYELINFSEISDRTPEVITDDNMITEYKHGRAIL